MDIIDQLKLLETGKVSIFQRGQTILAARGEIERLRAALSVAQTYLPHVRPEAPVEGLMAAQRLIAEALEQSVSTPSLPGKCVDGEPSTCAQPYNWDDGVPYCDTCGLYRDTIAMQAARARRP